MTKPATRTPKPAADNDVWIASGVRTPFARAGGALARHDALSLSAPVVKAMLAKGARPDLMVWGAVIPNLSFAADDPGYKSLKSALEGSTFSSASNLLIYATSNRRHLLPALPSRPWPCHSRVQVRPGGARRSQADSGCHRRK